jgi:hypothetical protein
VATYCEIEDLLLGEIAEPDQEVSQKYVQAAADEIDSKLGFTYVTPIVIDISGEFRASALLLKRINIYLTTGRLILAFAASREDQYLNAYGKSLVVEATEALNALLTGTMPLPGAILLNTDTTGATGPIINNLDPQSNVESFYAFATDPFPSRGYPLPYPPGVIYPGQSSRTW